jgi:hypothetical protein
MPEPSANNGPPRLSWDWLRWAAVLPAAIASYLGIQFVIALFRGLEDGFAERPDYKSQFICSIIGPYFLVWAGAKTAPRFRFVTALALTVLYAIANGSLATLAVMRGYQSGPLWWLIINGVVGIVATIVACLQMRKEEDKNLVG